MPVKLIISIIFFFAINTATYAQSYWDSSISEKAVEGIAGIAQSIISDSFVPMTHYKKGDITTSFVPAYFEVGKAFEDPDINAKGFDGYSCGIGFGYAVTDSLMVYMVGSSLKMDGTLEASFYGEEFGSFDGETKYNLVNLFTGAGIDLINNEKLSIPLYLGFGFMRYDTSLQLPSQSVTSPIPYTLDVDIEGEENLYTASLGIAFSYIFLDSLRTTLYFLHTQSFNRAKLDAEVLQSGSANYNGTEEIELDKIKASMLGFNVTYLASEKWSFSFNAGSIISKYTGFNEMANDGVEMLSIVATITYRSNLLD